MKHHIKTVVLLMFMFLILYCCSREIIEISVLKPADTIIPHEIETITIFPIAGRQEAPGNFSGVKHIPLDKETNYNAAKLNYVYGIYDVLIESPRFRRVVMADSSYVDSLLAGKMDIRDVREMCKADSTDAALLVTRIDNLDMLESMEENQQTGFIFHFFSKIKIDLYQPFLVKGKLSYSFNDVKYYDSYKVWYSDRAYKVLSDMCYWAGIGVGKQLVPYWEEEKRCLLNGLNTDLKTSVRIASKGNWDEAAGMWNSLLDSNLKRLAAKSSYNIALTWERADNLQQALQWINYADSLRSMKAIDRYKAILTRRLHELDTIQMQMPVY